MHWSEIEWKRKFSLTLYKNRAMQLGEMSFFKDFVNDTRGDLYPVLDRDDACRETVAGGKYTVTGGRVTRLLGQHFPYATYEATLESLTGSCGFALRAPGAQCAVRFSVEEGSVVCAMGEERIPSGVAFTPGMRCMVTCRGAAMDVYLDADSFPAYVCTFTAPGFEQICRYDTFANTAAALEIDGGAVVAGVRFYLDCGVSQADMRPIRYENGEIMVEGGKVYLSMSIRMQVGHYQGVFSWVPGTGEIDMVGAIFYDAGDGIWGNDVALSLLYHRAQKRWYYWVCSFSHDHVLGHGIAEGEVRFGVNVLDITLMEKMGEGDPDTAFLGKPGDEDPDFLYDEKRQRWMMTICRLTTDESGTNYRYFLFESERPFDGYTYVANARSGAETGGSILRTEDGYALICGSGFDRRAEYHAYTLPDLSRYELLHSDYDDGGFRGWGTVMSIPCGSRRRLFWLTFDRHKGSDYNWSYGNLYGFEALMK